MTWTDTRKRFPDRWLLFEATAAHSQAGHQIIDEMAIVADFDEGKMAMRKYLDPKQAWSERRLFVLGLDSPLGEFTSEAKCLWGECEGNLLPAAEGAWNRPLKKFRPKTGVTTLVLGLVRISAPTELKKRRQSGLDY